MTIPGAPAIVSATAGNASVALAWRAPGSNGGGAISNYIIEYKVDGPSVTWTRFPRVASSATTATVTSLTNGTSYLFRVTAVNAAGIGPASNTSDPVMPVTVPTVPFGVVAVGGDKQARLTWNAPASNGGLAVIDYILEVRAAGAATWTTFADGVSAATSATVTGLTNGVTYTFRVTAKNNFGSSAASAASSPVVVLGLPGVPSAPVATAGVRAEVHLAWTAPTETGGVALTDYLIEYRRTTDTAWTSHPHTASPAAGIVINGLSTGSTYVFRVSAVNSLGAGLASAISNAVTVIAAPTQPTNVVARAGDKVVNLSWIAPATSNGSTITDYVIEMRKSTDAAWTVYADSVSAATTAVVANLVNGTTYAFRVTAKNAAGLSAPSAESLLVRPVGPAAGPTGVSGVGSRGTVTLNWAAPTDTGGNPITSYVVQYRVNRAGSAWVTARWPVGVSPTATTAKISGFVTRFGHLFRVAAVTSMGQGAWSAESAPINPFGA
jgi:titin